MASPLQSLRETETVLGSRDADHHPVLRRPQILTPRRRLPPQLRLLAQPLRRMRVRLLILLRRLLRPLRQTGILGRLATSEAKRRPQAHTNAPLSRRQDHLHEQRDRPLPTDRATPQAHQIAAAHPCRQGPKACRADPKSPGHPRHRPAQPVFRSLPSTSVSPPTPTISAKPSNRATRLSQIAWMPHPASPRQASPSPSR